MNTQIKHKNCTQTHTPARLTIGCTLLRVRDAHRFAVRSPRGLGQLVGHSRFESRAGGASVFCRPGAQKPPQLAGAAVQQLVTCATPIRSRHASAACRRVTGRPQACQQPSAACGRQSDVSVRCRWGAELRIESQPSAILNSVHGKCPTGLLSGQQTDNKASGRVGPGTEHTLVLVVLPARPCCLSARCLVLWRSGTLSDHAVNPSPIAQSFTCYGHKLHVYPYKTTPPPHQQHLCPP